MIAELKSLQKTVAASGTAEPLSAEKILAYGLIIKALPGNTNNVYVGGSTVSTSTGYVLDASQELKTADLSLPPRVPVDLSLVYIDADTNGEGVTVSYVEAALS